MSRSKPENGMARTSAATNPPLGSLVPTVRGLRSVDLCAILGGAARRADAGGDVVVVRLALKMNGTLPSVTWRLPAREQATLSGSWKSDEGLRLSAGPQPTGRGDELGAKTCSPTAAHAAPLMCDATDRKLWPTVVEEVVFVVVGRTAAPAFSSTQHIGSLPH